MMKQQGTWNRRLAFVLAAAMLLTMWLPASSFAATKPDWANASITGESDSTVKFSGQDTVAVSYNVDTGANKIKNVTSICLAFDNTVFGLLTWDGQSIREHSAGDLFEGMGGVPEAAPSP